MALSIIYLEMPYKDPEKRREYDREYHRKKSGYYEREHLNLDWSNPEEVRKWRREYMRKWRRKDPEKSRQQYREDYHRNAKEINERTMERRNKPENRKKYNIRCRITSSPHLYPLDEKCVFCSSTENLEHGHLDYEDNGENYLTVCSSCNKWMDKPI